MLWAITSYFNPSEYKSRVGNYRRFRRSLKVPLIAVELSFTGRFELQPTDADILVQLVGGAILWQKERLLNVALRNLPRDCDVVAWLDCDLIFAADDWVERARAALKVFPLLQLFSESCQLSPEATYDSSNWDLVDKVAPGRAYQILTGRYAQEVAARTAAIRAQDRSSPGLAWAAERTLVDRHGLYDARIVGGGDGAMLSAALGEFVPYQRDHALNSRQMEHYRAWGEGFFASVGGKIGYIDGRIFHLWHGEKKDRNYAQRQRDLVRFGFDPFSDIAIDDNGAWRWNSEKPGLHQYVRDYFASRNEDDGPTAQKLLAPASPREGRLPG